MEALREQAKLDDAKKRDALEKKKAGSAAAKLSRDAKLKEEAALEQSKRKTMPRKAKSPVRGIDTDQTITIESDAINQDNKSPLRDRNQIRDESPPSLARVATPNPYDDVDPSELLMSAFGPPSPAVAESGPMSAEIENQLPRELHPDYEGRKLNAQATAAAAAAEAAAAAAAAAQAAAVAHTAAEAEEAAAAATQAAVLATAAAAIATADASLAPSGTLGTAQSFSLVESLPPADSVLSPRVAPWLQEARSSVKDLAASSDNHQQFLEFTKEPGLADEYLPSPDIKKLHGGQQSFNSSIASDALSELQISSESQICDQALEARLPVLEISSSSRADVQSAEVLTRPSPVERASGGGDAYDSRFSGPMPSDSQVFVYDDPISSRTGVEGATRSEVPPPSREAADKGSIPVNEREGNPRSEALDVKVAGGSSALPADRPIDAASSVPDTISRDSSAHLSSVHQRDEYEDGIISNDTNLRQPVQQDRASYNSSVSATAHALANPVSLTTDSIIENMQRSSESQICDQALEARLPVLEISSSSRADVQSAEVLTRPSPVERASGGGDAYDSRFSGPMPSDSQVFVYDDPISSRTGVEGATRSEVPPPSREAADKGSIPVNEREGNPRSEALDVKVAGGSSALPADRPIDAASSVPDTISRDSSAHLSSVHQRDEYEDGIISNDTNLRQPVQQDRASYNSSVSATAHALANPFSQSLASVVRQTGENTGRDAISSVFIYQTCCFSSPICCPRF
jgi:hypothetical protein